MHKDKKGKQIAKTRGKSKEQRQEVKARSEREEWTEYQIWK